MNLFDLIDIPRSSRTDWRPSAPPVLDGIDNIILDVETDGLEWWKGKRIGGIGYYLPDGRTGYLPIKHHGGNNLDESVVKQWAQQELRGKNITNISTKFDVHHFREFGADLEEQGCTVADVAYDAALLDENRKKFALEELCLDFLPEHERKVLSVGRVALDPNRMMDYPADMIAVRAEADCRQVALLKQVFDKKISDERLERVRQLEYDCIFPVCEMERLGAPINVELLHQWVRESEIAVNQLLKEIAREVGFLINPDRSSDWQRLFERLKLPLPETRTEKKGEISFAEAYLKTIDHPIVKKTRRLKKLMSLRQKYLVPYKESVGADELLRYHLHQLRVNEYGTVSGRFSASEKNIQQVMDDEKQEEAFESDEFLIRRLFISKLQYYLYSDARQIEFRLFGHYSKAPKVIKAYEENPLVSFHDIVHEAIKRLQPDTPYKTAKNCNFARLYGAGMKKLAVMIGLPDDEAEKFVAVYDKMFPEAKQLLTKAMDIAEKNNRVRTLLGRCARFPKRIGHRNRHGQLDETPDMLHKALNSVIQGSAADIMKRKIIELHRTRKITGFLMRYTVHDSVNGDVPSIESAKMVDWVLNYQSFPVRVPILWQTKIGANWADAESLEKIAT